MYVLLDSMNIFQLVELRKAFKTSTGFLKIKMKNLTLYIYNYQQNATCIQFFIDIYQNIKQVH